MVPQQEHAHVIAVKVDVILRVMHAMIRRSLDPSIEDTQSADVPRVRPELIEELNDSGYQEHVHRNTAQSHGDVEDPVGKRACAGLPQRRGQIEFFALMMNRVRCPKQAHGVAQPMLPVIAEVVKHKSEHPGEPITGGQREQSVVGQHPSVCE